MWELSYPLLTSLPGSQILQISLQFPVLTECKVTSPVPVVASSFRVSILDPTQGRDLWSFPWMFYLGSVFPFCFQHSRILLFPQLGYVYSCFLQFYLIWHSSVGKTERAKLVQALPCCKMFSSFSFSKSLNLGTSVLRFCSRNQELCKLLRMNESTTQISPSPSTQYLYFLLNVD